MEKKKPGFKAPAFSVPSKAGADKATLNKSCVKESMKNKKSNESKDEDKRGKKPFWRKVQNKEKKLKLKTEGVSAAGDSTSVEQVNRNGDGIINKEIEDDKENICDTDRIPDCAGDQTKEQNEMTDEEKTENEDKAKEDKKPALKEKVQSNLGKRKQDTCLEGKNERKNEKKVTLPVRSLTDEEYQEIFAATIDNALNMDIDNWSPECSKEKKYKKRVGKPTSSQEEKKGSEKKKLNKEAVKKDKPNKDNVLKEKNDCCLDEAEKEGQSENRDETNENKTNMEIAEDVEDANTNQEPERVDVQIEAQVGAQIENETTPVGSGDELTTATLPQSPPHKKVKLNKPPKKTKLVPKHLPFEKKAGENKKKEKKVTVRKDKHPGNKKTEKKKMSSPSDVKVSGKMSDRRKEMISRNINIQGTWVQCCRIDCKKWRYLPNVSEPSKIPEYWTCSMNTREDYNSCDKPEESYDETDHIYTKYCEGSIVLAKMAGYPWWPAMIEVDPDFDVFCWIDQYNNMLPTHYHVVFLDEKVSRVWLKASQILPFNGDEEVLSPNISRSKKRGPSYGKELSIAKRNALNALDYPIQDRIKLFGFATKFKGQWATENLKVNTGAIHTDETKQRKRKRELPKDEAIDESTMDDVLDNTEALLSNVEEMLDSLDSQIYDSNEDSDFSVSEFVAVEVRKKESRKERGNIKKKMAQICSDSSDQEIEVEQTNEQNGELYVGAEMAKIVPIDNSVVVKGTTVSFDKDVFTMELDHEENGNIVEIVDDLKNSGLGVELKEEMMQESGDENKGTVSEKINEEKSQDSLCKNDKFELENNDMIDENKNKPKSNKTVKSKEGSKNSIEDKPAKKSKEFKKPTVKKTKKKATENVKNSENVDKNHKETAKDYSKSDTKSSEIDKKQQSLTDETPDDCRNVNESEGDSKHDKERMTIESQEAGIDVNENMEDSKPWKETVVNKSQEAGIDVKENMEGSKSGKEKVVNKSKEIGIDVNENVEEVSFEKSSPLLSTNDALVPEVTDELMNAETDFSQNEGISLEDDTKVEFDLEDHSLYEGDTGANKITERAMVMESIDVPPGAIVMEEDSDPFDMIEE